MWRDVNALRVVANTTLYQHRATGSLDFPIAGSDGPCQRRCASLEGGVCVSASLQEGASREDKALLAKAQ